MINKTVIALMGKKRSGKDTAGAYLYDKYGVSQFKLAEPIKDIAKLMFDWTDEMVEGIFYDREEVIPELGLSVRQFLQEVASFFKYDLGSKHPLYKEQQGIRVWVNILLKEIAKHYGSICCITDVRFPEEIETLREQVKQVYVVELISDRSPEDNHISETSIVDIKPDSVIINNGYESYPTLYEGLDEVMKTLGYSPKPKSWLHIRTHSK